MGIAQKRQKIAASSVIGTLLMLTISMALFASLYYFTSTIIAPPPQPPSMNALVAVENGAILVMHRGGESVSLDAKVLLEINGIAVVNGYVEEYLDQSEKENGYWDYGETIVIDFGYPSEGKMELLIIDTQSNEIILRSYVDFRPQM